MHCRREIQSKWRRHLDFQQFWSGRNSTHTHTHTHTHFNLSRTPLGPVAAASSDSGCLRRKSNCKFFIACRRFSPTALSPVPGREEPLAGGLGRAGAELRPRWPSLSMFCLLSAASEVRVYLHIPIAFQMWLFFLDCAWGLWDLSSPTKGWTLVPAFEVRSLNTWTPRGVPAKVTFFSSVFTFTKIQGKNPRLSSSSKIIP